MNNDQLLRLLTGDSRFNKARQILATYRAQLDSGSGRFFAPTEIRKMEFEAIEKILEVYGLDPNGGVR